MKSGKDKNDSSKSFNNFSIGEFFALMNKLNAKEIRFDFATKQVVVEFNNGKAQQLNNINSGLSSEQKQRLEKELKSAQQPITFSQVSDQYNKRGKNNPSSGNAGIIAAILVVGVILAVVIGVVIHKNKKRDY